MCLHSQISDLLSRSLPCPACAGCSWAVEGAGESKGKAASKNHQNRYVFLKERWEKVSVNLLAGDCYVSDHIRHPAI